MIGQVVGSCLIKKQLGEGGMAAVYLGEHVVMKTPRAIKVLLPGLGQDATQMQRFIAEAMIAGRLGHPNIVTIYDCGQMPSGQWFIVMDYLKGRDLAKHWEERGKILTPAEIVEIISQVCSALRWAHW